jgi:hypothetical protein
MTYPSLTPTYGLGSYGRIVGATLISSPRTRYGSASRVYQYLARTQGQLYAIQYFRDASFGPFIIKGGRLVWN